MLNEHKARHLPEAPRSPEAEKRRELRERLDERARFYGGMLAKLDRLAQTLEVQPDGTIVKPRQDLGFNDDEKSAFRLIQHGMVLSRSELARRVAEIKKDRLVKGADFVFGATVITFDSSEGVPVVIPQSFIFEEGTRGEYSQLAGSSLGAIGVDLNKALRGDRVSATTSLIHELHHHVRAVIDIAIAIDSKTDMDSSTRSAEHQGVVDAITKRKYRNYWERVEHDRDAYEALLNRDIPTMKDFPAFDAVTRDIKAQRAYLDELHSSYLQKKPSWFSAPAKVYSSEGKGLHHELVGTHPDDIAAAKNLFVFMQGMWTADLLHKRLQAATPERMLELTREYPGMQQFLDTFDETFVHVGALIGVSRTVLQAERLVADVWRDLRTNDFVQAKLPTFMAKFAQTPGLAGTAGDGRGFQEFLLA
ncbi:MAG: hypothetical protein UY72_C0019G0005 [Candidatus Uhrbacteria bacterium GW2011_GWD2_52_7]|uniref:Uncharacterized protein n=1 Tax=Candidatus Uhrbacteria bacterium GW2011_GWD2_52_7 TaxID=1618989 RepID=A0A0G1XG19_9BACT|nr:MAG: hypothetical protein UY72_C0019G0005 [Candidatus Uhrbacteria bacterium GW2011_GWD2_52_7]